MRAIVKEANVQVRTVARGRAVAPVAGTAAAKAADALSTYPEEILVRHHKALLGLPLLCGMLALSSETLGQSSGAFPQKPIKVIIPAPPGGSVDGEIRIPVQQVVEK